MSDEKPEIQLFIKSSTIDREQKGSCPLCQQWFMAACILTEQGILSFHVTIVDAESPPKEFKDLSQSKIFPVVKGIQGKDSRGQDIGDKLADDHEQLEKFFESFGCPDLKRDGAVQKHFDDLYKHFNSFLLEGTDQSRQRLVHHLEKLNSFLEGEDQIYVIKDNITYGDCYLMPRLHHIKVACREYANFEIPEEMFYVWRYLYETYKTNAFQTTCPTDQDIIKHYEKKAKVFKPRKGVPSLQKATYSFDIPESVLERIESQPREEGSSETRDELYLNTHNNAFAGQRGTEEENIYEAPDSDLQAESAPDTSYDPQPPEPEMNYEAAESYEAPVGGQEPDSTSYDALGYTEPEPEVNYELDDAEPVTNGSPARSASPEPMQTHSPARSVSPVPDEGVNLNDSLDQTYDDPNNYNPPEQANDDSGSAVDSTTPAGQDEMLYENVDTSNAKSVDFTVTGGDANAYDDGEEVKVNGNHG